MSPCPTPLPLATLVDYWIGDLALEADAETEDHLFGCAACSQGLEWVAEIALAIGPVVRRGRLRLLLTPALIERLERDGVQLRHHHVEPGGQTACTAAPADQLLVQWLHGDFHAGERVDLVLLNVAGGVEERLEDVPVDHARGRVVWAERADVIRAAPIPVFVMRLLGVSPAGERAIGEYTLVHTEWPGG